MDKKIFYLLFVMIACLHGFSTNAQSLLSKLVTIKVEKQRLDAVLQILSNKGDFEFSYKSDIVPRDSIVSLNMENRTIKYILDILFNGRLDYVETGNYIILRGKPIGRESLLVKEQSTEKWYTIKGKIYDHYDGMALSNVSIYEKDRLVSTLTNSQGQFVLKLRSVDRKAALSISKVNYSDTTIILTPRYNQELFIMLQPIDRRPIVSASPIQQYEPGIDVGRLITDSFSVDQTRLGRFFLSSKARASNRNIKNFLANSSFQVSLVPGLSTYGFLNSKLTNKFSFNIIGGYTYSVSKLEVGGVFNIDNKDVRYTQIAGALNLVGGTVKGLQLSGVINYVGGVTEAVQLAGVYNHVKGKGSGAQIAGTMNLSEKKYQGIQLAGVVNIGSDSMKGMQIAGAVNYLKGDMEGVQISGLINKVGNIKGAQIGVLNFADSVDGVSIGLLNFIKKGYHKWVASTNEITSVNVEYKTGNRKLYNILSLGWRPNPNSKIYAAGYGIGNETRINPRIAVNTELSTHYLYLGSWDWQNNLHRLSVMLNVSINKRLAIFVGPSFSVYQTNQSSKLGDFAFDIHDNGLGNFRWSNSTRAWFGLNAGIQIF